MRARLFSIVAMMAATPACGDNHAAAPDAGGGVDGGGGGSALPEMAAGTQLVDHAAVVTGITSDGYVAYYDYDHDGHGVAHVIPIGGGGDTVIATSAGTGKQDVRFAVHGSVVFAWTDRGNRVATLTMWSAATGIVAAGSGIRPGIAAATDDGSFVAYERDVTSTTVDFAAGPIGGTQATIATGNSQDSDCWRDNDLASAGGRVLARFCDAGDTAWQLHSYAGDGTGDTTLSASANVASYGAREVWLDGSGALWSSLPDGTQQVTLATGAVGYHLSDDLGSLAALTSDGKILTMPVDGTGSATTLVASGATMLGNVSANAQTVLYASMTSDNGESAPVQPYSNVIAASGSGSVTLVSGTTSCPSCLFESFTGDGASALVLDPIDNSPTADGEGTLRVVSLASGQTEASFGSVVYDAVAIPGSSRFMFLEATPDSSEYTGWAYQISTRDPIASGSDGATGETTFAENAEDFALDAQLQHEVVSFSTGPLAGIWVAELK